MPAGSVNQARAFCSELLGLSEIPNPEPLRAQGAVWIDVGGLDLHLTVEDKRSTADTYRHFGLEFADVSGLRQHLETDDVKTEDGRPAPWHRFFVRDPFGDRIEIHEAGGLRA